MQICMKRVTHLDLWYAAGQVGPQVLQSSADTVDELGIVATALFDVRGY